MGPWLHALFLDATLFRQTCLRLQAHVTWVRAQKIKRSFDIFMNTSPKSNDQQKSDPHAHHDALSGWGTIIGAVAGALIGLFCDRVILLGSVLGATGWIVGALIDRSRR